MSSDDQLKVILFDLGGVLLRLNDPLKLFGMQMSDAEFKSRWLRFPAVRDFERGRLSADDFAKAIVSEAGLPYDWREFLRRFDAWPDRLFDGAIELLDAIPARFARGLLSNINAQHWQRAHIAGLLSGHLDRSFLSFETGLVKPDREAFELVIDSFGCRPGEVLFFDDSALSVSAAADLGMQAVLAAGLDTVREALVERAVFDQS